MGSYPSAEVQSVYSTAQADWATSILKQPVHSIIPPVSLTSDVDKYFANENHDKVRILLL